MTYDFHSLYSHGFLRLGAAVPKVVAADPVTNVAETLKLARQAHANHAGLVVFPELGLSAYAIDDLLLQDALLDAVEAAIAELVEASKTLMPVLVVGAPLRSQGRLYNCAVAIHGGQVLGVVPKVYLPNYREFYERRHFTSGAGVWDRSITLAGQEAPFGPDQIFRSTGAVPFTFHIEICEDIWVPIPPSSAAALAGAEVLVNLSASNIVIGKAETRKLLCASQSARTFSAYIYTAAGPGESTTDLAWDGQNGIFECGDLLAESERFKGDLVTYADIDLDRIRQDRMRSNTFGDNAENEADRTEAFRWVDFALEAPKTAAPLERAIERFPFVPSDAARLREDCYEAYNIQVEGLAKRLAASHSKHAIIGVSGGLDSTHALIVAARAMDRLGLPRANVLAYTLPGFATSDGTKSNAWALIRAIGATGEEIDIKPAAQLMLEDIGHPFAKGQPVYDVTFENVQAGLRTDYLFRLANRHGGLVVGTGDLSELALGWCTYGVGDQMSHYNVNAGVSKTLIQHLIRFVARSGDVDEATAKVLLAVLDTEISPELVPAGADGAIQSTESLIGPYALHDFTLHYVARYGYRPSKIAFLALNAWGDEARGAWPADVPRRAFGLADIRQWMAVFLKRFFETSQFKRSALPNGPKISSAGALSPRGDWRAPSDSVARVWLAELDAKVPKA
ncbi:MAG TPA: NAD(+) synthase [Caulobacteraceae bacterium]